MALAISRRSISMAPRSAKAMRPHEALLSPLQLHPVLRGKSELQGQHFKCDNVGGDVPSDPHQSQNVPSPKLFAHFLIVFVTATAQKCIGQLKLPMMLWTPWLHLSCIYSRSSVLHVSSLPFNRHCLISDAVGCIMPITYC